MVLIYTIIKVSVQKLEQQELLIISFICRIQSFVQIPLHFSIFLLHHHLTFIIVNLTILVILIIPIITSIKSFLKIDRLLLFIIVDLHKQILPFNRIISIINLNPINNKFHITVHI